MPSTAWPRAGAIDVKRGRHKPSKRGRQPGTKVAKPVDPILAAAQVDAGKAKPSGDGFAAQPVEPVPETPAEPLAPPSTAPLTSRAAQHLSLNAVAQVLNVDRSVVERWIKVDGAPVKREAIGLGHGQGWEIDLAKLWKWWGEHSAREALADAGVGLEIEPKDKLILLKIAKDVDRRGIGGLAQFACRFQ